MEINYVSRFFVNVCIYVDEYIYLYIYVYIDMYKCSCAGAIIGAASKKRSSKQVSGEAKATWKKKKVNFEESNKESLAALAESAREGNRVTSSLIKTPLSRALYGPSVADEQYGEESSTLPPNRALWIVHRCRPVATDSVAEVLLEDFLNRILSLYGSKIPSWASLDDPGRSRSASNNGELHEMSADGQPLYVTSALDSAVPEGEGGSGRWRFSSTGEIIGLLARAKRLLTAGKAARVGGQRDVKSSLKRFVRWVMAVDHAATSLLLELEDEYGEPLTLTADGNDRAADKSSRNAHMRVEYVSAPTNNFNSEDDGSGNRKRRIRHGAEFEVLTPTGLTPVVEKQLIKAIAQDLSVFFTQVRASGVVDKLTRMLRPVTVTMPLMPPKVLETGLWTPKEVEMGIPEPPPPIETKAREKELTEEVCICIHIYVTHFDMHIFCCVYICLYKYFYVYVYFHHM
jgi:hypothetical protein